MMNPNVHAIRTGYKAGKTYEHLAEDFGLSVGTIRRMIKGMGAYEGLEDIARKPGRVKGSFTNERALDEEEQNLIRLDAMEGTTYRQLAATFGVSHTTIGHVVNRTGAYALD